MQTTVHINFLKVISCRLYITVAEKDTAAAAKAAVGRPKAAVGRQRAAHRLRLAAAARPRPPICLKIDSLAYNGLIRLLSRTHAQAVSLSIDNRGGEEGLETRIQTCSDVTANARHGTPPRLDCTIIVVGRIDRVSERRRTVSDHKLLD